MSTNNKTLRLFVAFPSDVSAESQRIGKVIDRLKVLSDHLGIEFEILDWKKVIPEMGRPEQVIIDQLKPASWDIFVGILWQRFGTPTGANDKITHQPYSSGTEEEFYLAYRLWQQYKRPQIIFYRCLRPIDPDKIDSKQIDDVNNFFKQFHTGGKHLGLYQSFRKTKEFEDLLFEHLKTILIMYNDTEKKISIPEKSLISSSIIYPFPRRSPFFGREKDKERVLLALSSEERSWGVIIDGISGIGKTALAIEIAYQCDESNIFDKFVFVSAKKRNSTAKNIHRETFLNAEKFDDFIRETYQFLKDKHIDLMGDVTHNEIVNAIGDYRVLFIYDNLEDLDKAEQEKIFDWLRYLPQSCKAIVTTRRRSNTDGAYALRLGPIEWDVAHGIITNYVNLNPRVAEKIGYAKESKLKELHGTSRGSPLVLLNNLDAMRDNITFSFDDAIKRGISDLGLQEKMFSEIGLSPDVNTRIILFTLSLFSDSMNFETLLEVASIPIVKLEPALNWLDAYSFIYINHQEASDFYSIHPLTRDYIQSRPDLSDDIINNIKIKYVRLWTNFVQQNGGDRSFSSHNTIKKNWENISLSIKILLEVTLINKSNEIVPETTLMIKSLANALNTYLWFSGKQKEYITLFSLAYEKMIEVEDWISAGQFALNITLIELEKEDFILLEKWQSCCIDAWTHDMGLQELGLIARIKGLIARKKGELEDAYNYFSISLNAWNDINFSGGIAASLTDLGNLSFLKGNHSEAEIYYTQAADIAEITNDIEGQLICAGKLGDLALTIKNETRAEESYLKELFFAEKTGHTDSILHGKFGLARMFYKKEPHKAIGFLEEIIQFKNILSPEKLIEAENLINTIKSSSL